MTRFRRIAPRQDKCARNTRKRRLKKDTSKNARAVLFREAVILQQASHLRGDFGRFLTFLMVLAALRATKPTRGGLLVGISLAALTPLVALISKITGRP